MDVCIRKDFFFVKLPQSTPQERQKNNKVTY